MEREHSRLANIISYSYVQVQKMHLSESRSKNDTKESKLYMLLDVDSFIAKH